VAYDIALASDPETGDGTRALLQSIVEVARAIFGAAASSVFLLDEPAGELVFQAVAGEGADFLIGTRMPANRGIAGWVVNSGQAMIADDLASNPAFARDLAESTRYVPDALMAAPLLSADQVLGVLEVIDPAPQSRSDLGDLDLLSLFANQAALALRVAQQNRSATRTPARPAAEPGGGAGDGELSARLVDEFREFLRHRGE
jgi:GAF domain-containing protein